VVGEEAFNLLNCAAGAAESGSLRNLSGCFERASGLIRPIGAAMVPANAGSAGEGANSAECKEITARLIEATNSTFDGYSPMGDNVFLKHPDMLLRCMTHRLTGVSLEWDDSGFPPKAWFVLLAKAGQAVTRVDVKTLEAASRKCHRSALKEQDSLADLDIPNAKIECQAFADSGGASSSAFL
jgi:hypothetical protein